MTLLGLALFTLIGVGIRVLVMLSVQRRRERANRQINERLRVLIAAYKVLGGSFTGDLAVDPTHKRDLLRRDAGDDAPGRGTEEAAGSDRGRRIRDAVEAALSDIILLGTAEQVRLAARAAREMAEGRPVHTDALVVSLRDFVRVSLDLDPVPGDAAIPPQGPTRPAPGGGRGGRGEEGRGEGRRGGGQGGGAAVGAGAGMGVGLGLGVASGAGEEPERRP